MANTGRRRSGEGKPKSKKKADAGSEREFSMQDLRNSLLNENKTMMESEKLISEYLERCGLIPEAKISDESRARAKQRLRQENYHNIHSLLENYRSLVRTYILFKENFADEVLVDRKIKIDDSSLPKQEEFFQTLCEQVELMSVQEERRFQRTYAPYIITGAKIEAALKAINKGMNALYGFNPFLYDVINLTYLEGDTRPSIRELMERLGMESVSNFYRYRRLAEEKLTLLIFRFEPSRAAELHSIFAFLRQQTEDDYFPDFMD